VLCGVFARASFFVIDLNNVDSQTDVTNMTNQYGTWKVLAIDERGNKLKPTTAIEINDFWHTTEAYPMSCLFDGARKGLYRNAGGLLKPTEATPLRYVFTFDKKETFTMIDFYHYHISYRMRSVTLKDFASQVAFGHVNDIVSGVTILEGDYYPRHRIDMRSSPIQTDKLEIYCTNYWSTTYIYLYEVEFYGIPTAKYPRGSFIYSFTKNAGEAVVQVHPDTAIDLIIPASGEVTWSLGHRTNVLQQIDPGNLTFNGEYSPSGGTTMYLQANLFTANSGESPEVRNMRIYTMPDIVNPTPSDYIYTYTETNGTIISLFSNAIDNNGIASYVQIFTNYQTETAQSFNITPNGSQQYSPLYTTTTYGVPYGVALKVTDFAGRSITTDFKNLYWKIAAGSGLLFGTNTRYIYFRTNSFSSDIELHLEKYSFDKASAYMSANPIPGKDAAGFVAIFAAQERNNKPLNLYYSAEVCFDYTEAELVRANVTNEAALVVYYHNRDNWVPLSTRIDPVTNTATVSAVNNLGVFGIFELPRNLKKKIFTSSDILYNHSDPTKSTSVYYILQMSAPEVITFVILDRNGRLIKTLVSSEKLIDLNVAWDGTDMYGVKVPSGVYIYSLSGSSAETSLRGLTVVRHMK